MGYDPEHCIETEYIGIPAEDNVDDCPDDYDPMNTLTNRGLDYGGFTCAKCDFGIHRGCKIDLGDGVYLCNQCSYLESSLPS